MPYLQETHARILKRDGIVMKKEDGPSGNIRRRNNCEWSNFWWEDANDHKKPRVLLVGDSIAVGYRPFVYARLGEWACVDMYASSRAICDPAYMKEIRYSLSEYTYRAVHFNNGLHGDYVTAGEYRRQLETVVNLIRNRQPDAGIVLALSTPVTKIGNTAVFDEEKNVVICKRNSIVTDVAHQYGLIINDLYELMRGKSEVRLNDGYHYKPEGQRIQADKVAAIVAEIL